jgi:hypothetical protein
MSEAIYAPEAKSYELPDEGTVQAICADFIDLGDMPNFDGTGVERKVQFVFQVEQTGSDGNRLQVRSKPLNLKSGEKAALQIFIESWIRGGKRFTATDPLHKVNLAGLVGTPALISIVHNTSAQGGVFANIGNLPTPLPKGVPAMKIEGYVRRERKPKDTKAQASPASRVGKGEKLPF